MTVGDVVLLKDENQSRNFWRLGRVVKTNIDDDGIVRNVKLALAESNLNAKARRTSACSFLEQWVQK